MSLPRFNFPARRSTVVWVVSLCSLSVFCSYVVSKSYDALTTETQTTQSLHRDYIMLAALPQSPELDYSTFKHTSQKHASLACNSCHQRGDNSATPRFPGHKACTGCHVGQ